MEQWCHFKAPNFKKKEKKGLLVAHRMSVTELIISLRNFTIFLKN